MPGGMPRADQVWGSDTFCQSWSGSPGRSQPLSEPYRPAAFMIPRTGSCRVVPPGSPISRQVIAADEPARAALYRPTFSPLGPSGLPVFSTSTAITLSFPVRSAPAGNVNVALVAPAAAFEPRKAPFSQTENAPVGEMPSAARVTPVSVPVAVKCPRYQTKPWS